MIFLTPVFLSGKVYQLGEQHRAWQGSQMVTMGDENQLVTRTGDGYVEQAHRLRSPYATQKWGNREARCLHRVENHAIKLVVCRIWFIHNFGETAFAYFSLIEM